MSKKKTTEDFIDKARKIHGGKYLYERVVYAGCYTKVEIVCPKHGSFFQTPDIHNRGYGCPKCGFERTHNSHRSNKEAFIKKAKVKYGDRYDYSKVDYKGCYEPIEIVCREHGSFFMKPTYHLIGHRCPKCVSEEMTALRSSTTKDFIRKANKKHNGRYDYSKVDYKERNTPVTIICKIHGEFQQTPNIHLAGCGCPRCKQTKGEKLIEEFLVEKGIQFIKEYTLPNTGLFCRRKFLLADFYLPSFRTIIEYNGQQHYYPVSIFGGDEQFEIQKERDATLRDYCQNNGIKLIVIPYTQREHINAILSKKLKKR